MNNFTFKLKGILNFADVLGRIVLYIITYMSHLTSSNFINFLVTLEYSVSKD